MTINLFASPCLNRFDQIQSHLPLEATDYPPDAPVKSPVPDKSSLYDSNAVVCLFRLRLLVFFSSRLGFPCAPPPLSRIHSPTNNATYTTSVQMPLHSRSLFPPQASNPLALAARG